MEATAKHHFVPNDQETELAFKKNDRLLILNYGDQVQWYNALKDGQTGLVPGNYIEVTPTKWYMGLVSRSKAEHILQACEREGAFLVRRSESSPSEFSLSVKCGNSVQHFRILRDNDKQYFLWNKKFTSLNQLVEHYRNDSVSRTSIIYLRDMDDEGTFLAEAIYDFDPKEDSEDGEIELGFKKGDIITVFDCRDINWWGGRLGDRSGFFPRLYVQRTDFNQYSNGDQ